MSLFFLNLFFFSSSNPSFSKTNKNILTVLEDVPSHCGPLPKFKGFLKEHCRAVVLLHLHIKLYSLRYNLSKAVEMVIEVK